jgi:U3 small nucleolar RNA-associated protein 5
MYAQTIPLQRYSAPTKDVEMPEADDEPPATLPTDVDMADLSLGERLLALPNGGTAPSDPTLPPNTKVSIPTFDGPVNAASLTRILVQALHTSDPALLTLCFSHKDPVLIRNTIRKMPTQLALPLLKACVERLGKGKGANKRGGGRGGGQNEQQGRGTVEWVKGVLVERGAMLMTVSVWFFTLRIGVDDI